eukprot:3557414-Rhodomonas_salina.4
MLPFSTSLTCFTLLVLIPFSSSSFSQIHSSCSILPSLFSLTFPHIVLRPPVSAVPKFPPACSLLCTQHSPPPLPRPRSSSDLLLFISLISAPLASSFLCSPAHSLSARSPFCKLNQEVSLSNE